MLFLADNLLPGMDLLLQICFIGCGLYGLYTYRNMHRWKSLPANRFLYPHGAPVESCKDPKEFLKFMRPRVLIFSLLALFSGIFSAVTGYYLKGNPWCILATFGLCLGTVIYYTAVIIRVSRKFW